MMDILAEKTSEQLEFASSDLGLSTIGDLPFSGAVRPIHWSLKRHLSFYGQSLRFALPLLVSDVLCALFALTTVVMIASLLGTEWGVSLPYWMMIQSLSLVAAFTAFRLYANAGMHAVVELQRVVAAIVVTYLPLALVATLSPKYSTHHEAIIVIATGLIVSCMLPSVRHLVRFALGSQSWWTQPIVLIAGRDSVHSLVDQLKKDRHLGWNVIGYIDEFNRNFERTKDDVKCLGDENDFAEIVQQQNIFWAIVDGRTMNRGDAQRFMDRHQRDIPHMIMLHGDRTSSQLFTAGLDCGGAFGIHHPNSLTLVIPRVIKRLFDICVSTTALTLLSPLIAAICVAIKLGGKGPIFYSQDRIGKGGKTFKIWKFRSMVPNADKVLKEYFILHPELAEEWSRTEKLLRDPRISKVGWFLRKTSLDELPQLINVLNGTMSLIGPRPILRWEIAKYGDVYWLYARTKPGITGLWQVNGRNNTTYAERLEYVSFYVRNWSLWLDWYILLKTFRVVLLCKGAC